ncbi:MAG: hypothetical protein B7733_23695 [Myxococcales bacterium FL481]|nr:MAG: hypothetical protein B7733_23695 [Myxococcales bacterium FL481]
MTCVFRCDTGLQTMSRLRTAVCTSNSWRPLLKACPCGGPPRP